VAAMLNEENRWMPASAFAGVQTRSNHLDKSCGVF
jgi:hypothetical protein